MGVIGNIFLALAVIFLGLALQKGFDELKVLSAQLKTWIRISLVFAVICLFHAAYTLWLM